MMKKLIVVALLGMAQQATAESTPLPPIINHSTHANDAGYEYGSSSNQPLIDMMARLDTLQRELAQLRGVVERQGHQLKNLKQQQRDSDAELQTRLQQMSQAVPVAAAPVLPESSGSVPLAADEGNLAVPFEQRQAEADAAQAAAHPPKTLATEKDDFDQAFANVKNSQYQQAISLFQQFLLDYPTGKYRDNATFWLASVYKVVNNVPEAKKHFKQVYSQFPSSEKAPLAMFKLAEIYMDEKDSTTASQLYGDITRLYPGSTAAHMAEKKLQSVGR